MQNHSAPSGAKPGQKNIGLDIGSHSIKMVELISNLDGFELTRFSIKEIPRGLPAKKDRSQVIAGLVRTMFAEAGVKGNKVYLMVSGHNVVIRRATLPKMPREELLEAAKWNAKDEVLFDMEGAAVDCYIMKETKQEGAPYYELLSVIVKSDVIPGLMSSVQKAGLRPLGITVVPMALMDYDRVLNPTRPGTVTSYIDMGAERTRVYFLSDSELLFSREIPNGGENITEALTGTYDLSNGSFVTIDLARAEEIKKTNGLPAEGEIGETVEGISLAEIRRRVLPVVTKQAEEMLRSIEYFKNQYKKERVHRMVVSGGAVELRGLHRFLVENLEDIEIERCNVFLQASKHSFDIPEEESWLVGPNLTAAAGLALGQCDKINVLPEEYRPSFRKTLAKLAPYAAVFLVFAVLAGFSMFMRGSVHFKEDTLMAREGLLARLQAGIAALNQSQKEFIQLNMEKERLLKEKTEMEVHARFQVDFRRVFDEFSRVVAGNTMLTRISYASANRENGEDSRKGWFMVRGIVFGDEMRVQNTLKILLEDLRNSTVFQQVKLIRSKILEEGTYTRSGIDFKLSVLPVPKDRV